MSGPTEKGRPTPILLMVRELGIGGCENDLTKIAKGLDRMRFEPHVACFRAEGIRRSELDAAGVPILPLNLRSYKSMSAWSSVRALGRYVREHDIALIHAFDAPTEWFGIPVGRLYGVPVLVKSSLWERGAYSRGHRTASWLTDRIADAVVVNSRMVREDLIRKHSVPADRIHLNYNGVDPHRFHPVSRGVNASPANEIVIGTVCALRPEKRIDLLLEAFARVHAMHGMTRLLIGGSGPMRDQLENQGRRLRLTDVSRFEPTASDVTPWLQAMDIFVLTSETESFPNALLEAMASGCCVLASRVGGIPELVEDGSNGLLFERNNIDDLTAQLRRLVEQPALRQALAGEAVKTATQRFSLENNVRGAEAIYESLLGAKA